PLGGLWIAVGIGVNLARKPIDAERPATSIATYRDSPPPRPTEAIETLVEAFERWSRVWTSLGFPAVADAWTARAHGLGEPCVARLGTETLEGVAEGLDDDGALRLRLDDGRVRRITAGDVFFGGA
ncbi:MAG TPA: biotin--[acetyl-CoA-carboxylase] ligase, partial [Caulobacter sp.]|nr:biotin--[acetyl-CoA-carboxylase] ligase [Caulobacter sp.]